MTRTRMILLSLGALVSAAAQDSSHPKLTAREMFYQAADAPAAAAAPAPKPKPVVRPKPVSVAVAAPAPASAPAPAPPIAPDTSAHVAAPVETADGAQVVRVSTASNQASAMPLGLKYTILKKSGDEMVPVPPDSTFHAGDRIQFSVETNGPGYLYIISQGSSGAWKPMFPAPEIEGGDNHIQGFRAYTMPPGYRFAFDEQPGTEKVFIVLSRVPEPDLERLIYALRNGAKPASAPAETGEPRPLVASLIDDNTVGNLRKTYARDLVIEKVDDQTSDSTGKKETAVYVINPKGSNDSRVVADLALVHQ